MHDREDVSGLAAETSQTIYNLQHTMDFRCLKMELLAYGEGFNQGDHIFIGIADAQLTASEIAEAITNLGPLNSHDTDEVEQSERWVHVLGQLQASFNEDGIFPADGRPCVFKMPWTFRKDVGFTLFAFNPDPAVAITTTTYLTVFAKLYGVWVR